MFKVVLLPIDLGHDASWKKALPMAKSLAAGGELHLLGVAPDIGAAIVSSFLPEGFEGEALRALEKSLAGFADEHAPGARHHIRFGHVAESILSAAQKIGADLIVMASHPPDELRTMLVGSQAGKVVRNASIPVLVVR